MDWNKRKYPKGTRIKVIYLNKTTGEGELLMDYDLDDENGEIPRIKMDSGEILYGSECWWIPCEEV